MERFDAQWATSSTGRQLFDTTPRLSHSIAWTNDLTRKDVALVAQFLSGHYPSNQYLFRFHVRDDPSCCWCDAPLDDRDHRLFWCPRFEFIRQKLQSELAEHHTEGLVGWSWEFLSGQGRQFLVRFLRVVNKAMANNIVYDNGTD